MEAKHTPGPWFAVDYAGTFVIQDSEYYEGRMLLSRDDCKSKEQAKANAMLAAAAPELLKKLIEIEPVLTDANCELRDMRNIYISDCIKDANDRIEYEMSYQNQLERIKRKYDDNNELLLSVRELIKKVTE